MQCWQAVQSAGTNLVWVMVLAVLAIPSVSSGQSADLLLRDTAKNYQTLTDYELDGQAQVAIPGSVWQFTANFTVIGPRKKQSQDGGPPKTSPGAVRWGAGKFVKTLPDSSEQAPSVSLPAALLMKFGTNIADEVVGVERSGSETLKLDGENVPCDILKVTYAPSTYERPHPEAVTYSISPAKHLVLKEVLTYNAGRHTDNAL
jgi:hypothetical protein